MGVSVRIKDGHPYVFIRYRGERAAQKYETQEEAELVAAAVRHAMTLGQFDISAMKSRREEPKEEKPQTPTLAGFFDNTMSPLWKASLAAGTFSRYEVSFRLHVRPVLGDVSLGDLTRD